MTEAANRIQEQLKRFSPAARIEEGAPRGYMVGDKSGNWYFAPSVEAALESVEAALAQKTRECEELQHAFEEERGYAERLMKTAQEKHAQVEQLERQVASLSKPVTDEEVALAEKQQGKVPTDQILRGFIYRRDVANRIAARVALLKSENQL